MTTSKTSESAAKKDVAKLQRAIVDGLEDVKAQDIQVFNTEHLSPLFERVIVASGTSNRQTKALATSVQGKVKEAGFPKPRVEGEDNGEWIIVDCGAAVAHIMQPTIRQYYRLEDLWGELPVRLKLGAAKPAPAKKAAVKKKAPAVAEVPARLPGKPKAPAKAAPSKTAAAKPAVKKAPAAKTPATKAKAPAAKAPAAKAPAAKKAIKTLVVKPAAKKPVAKKAAGKSAPASKPAAKATKPAAKKAAGRASKA